MKAESCNAVSASGRCGHRSEPHLARCQQARLGGQICATLHDPASRCAGGRSGHHIGFIEYYLAYTLARKLLGRTEAHVYVRGEKNVLFGSVSGEAF